MRINPSKFLKLLLVALAFFAVSATSASAATYYVRNGGNDSATGTSDATAWASISKVNSFALAQNFHSGDIIQFKRGSVWTLQNDETLGNKEPGLSNPIHWGTINGLTIQDYGTGNKPRISGVYKQPIYINSEGSISNLLIKNIDISGTGWLSLGYSRGNLWVENATNIVIDGIYLDGHKDTVVWGTLESGIQTGKVGGNLEIKNCEIFNLVNISGPQGYDADDRHGILTWNQVKLEGTERIHDNIIHHVDADCIQSARWQTPQYIYNNKFSYFGENAIDLKNCRYAEIYGNEILRGDYLTGGGGTGDTDAANIVTHTFDDIDLVYRGQDISIHDNTIGSTAYKCLYIADLGTQVYNNSFVDCRTGILFHVGDYRTKVFNNTFDFKKDYACDYSNCSAIRYTNEGSYDNTSVYNNTMNINTNTHMYGIYYQALARNTGNSITNNIIRMGRNSSLVYPLYIQDYDGANSFPSISHNSVFGTNANRVNYDGVPYSASQLSAWKAFDSGAVFADPLIDPSSLRLQSGSPCKDTGVAISGRTLDKAGLAVPQGINPDMGAYEYQTAGDTVAPASPTGLSVK